MMEAEREAEDTCVHCEARKHSCTALNIGRQEVNQRYWETMCDGWIVSTIMQSVLFERRYLYPTLARLITPYHSC